MKEIPHLIHYCWFGGKPLPPLADKCIKSWQKFLPDYKIIRWDETNFPVNEIPFIEAAYQAGKYAFVSDYARLKILHEYGGLYFDTDVEIIRPIDDIIAAGPFMGCENESRLGERPESLGVNPGLGFGAYPDMELLEELTRLYLSMTFDPHDSNPLTIVEHTSRALTEHGLKNTPEIQSVAGFNIYPKEYFAPLSPSLIMHLTPQSRTIHHYAATWKSRGSKMKNTLKRLIGPRLTELLLPSLSAIKRSVFR